MATDVLIVGGGPAGGVDGQLSSQRTYANQQSLDTGGAGVQNSSNPSASTSDGGVSVATVVQTVEGEDEPTARLIIGTHRATEQALSATVDALADSEVVARVVSVLRVEGE